MLGFAWFYSSEFGTFQWVTSEKNIKISFRRNSRLSCIQTAHKLRAHPIARRRHSRRMIGDPCLSWCEHSPRFCFWQEYVRSIFVYQNCEVRLLWRLPIGGACAPHVPTPPARDATGRGSHESLGRIWSRRSRRSGRRLQRQHALAILKPFRLLGAPQGSLSNYGTTITGRLASLTSLSETLPIRSRSIALRRACRRQSRRRACSRAISRISASGTLPARDSSSDRGRACRHGRGPAPSPAFQPTVELQQLLQPRLVGLR